MLEPEKNQLVDFYFEQAVANYFGGLQKCYADAEQCGSATPVPIMITQQFSNLAPAARGDALREPMVLVNSEPQKPIPGAKGCVSHHYWRMWEAYVPLETS
jgi:hypothetical protein